MTDIQELESQLTSAAGLQARIDILNKIAEKLLLVDQERARQTAEQAYELSSSGEFEQQPYLLGLAASLHSLAALNNDAGKYDLALSQSLRALEILDGILPDALQQDKPQASKIKLDILGDISWTYRSYGDYGVAADYAMKALKLAQAVGDRRHEAGMLNVLSVIYAESNDLNAALEVNLRGLQYCREVGNARSESIALNNLAMNYLELGDGVKALEACRESLRLARENGIDAVAETALSTMGEIYLGMKDFARAEDYLLQALTLARASQAGSDELQCLLNLGKIYQYQKDGEAALSVFQSALSLSQVSNDRRGEFQCHQLLAEIYEKLGDLAAALWHYKQFHRLKETVFNDKTAQHLAGLKVAHQVETAKRDAEIHYLKTIELKREIEERKEAQESLQRLASIDPLTGVLNRREFFNMGERELERALQKRHPFTVILFDYDNFKKINDTYGHAVGDQVLVEATKMVRENLRQGEIIGRYGGDEFAILLPGSNGVQGKQIAERLCEKIAAQEILTAKGSLLVTLSLGIAELNPAGDETLETLLAHADQALYAAKQDGRDRLKIYTGMPSL